MFKSNENRSISKKPRREKRRNAKQLSFGALEPRQLLAADVVINEFLTSNSSGIVDGNNNESDWIELFHAGDPTQDPVVDLSGWHLSDNATELDKWTFPSGSEIQPGEYLVVFASGDGIADLAGNLHTSFSLSSDGEYLALTRSDLSLASEFGTNGEDYPSQFTDVSYGAGTGAAAFFQTPTPGAANGAEFAGVVDDTSFSIDRGYYTTAFDVAISTATPNATIYYTTDGSDPGPSNGNTYVSAINISSTTNLRAAAFRSGYIPTNIDTQTYIFGSDVLTQPDDPAGFPQPSTRVIDYEVDPEIANDPLYTDRLLAGLQSIPTVSLTSTVDDIFGNSGIYANPGNSNLEVPTSVEYILADGTTGFQIDAGLRIAGGASRTPSNSPKQSFTLRFRQEYGAGRLNYELFEGSPVDSFNSLQLRAVYNNSIIHKTDSQRDRGTLIRDQFIRDSLLAFGQDDAQRGEYTNLFINGLFWGVYNLHERADSSHFAEYNGGDPDDYDALNGGSAIDGDTTSWNALQAAVDSGTWQEVDDRLDVDNFIDWVIIQEYGGNSDLKTSGNWRAAGGGSADAKWKIYAWDSERVFEGTSSVLPGTLTDATGLLSDLRSRFPEFNLRFEDRIQLHYFDGGALTEEAVAERWQKRVDELDLAIVGETARWGDYRRDVAGDAAAELYERDVQWVAENQRILDDYIPVRGDNVLAQYESIGLFGSVDVPTLSIDGTVQNGGHITAGATLAFDAESTIYFTTDGSDPRLVGGGISNDAIEYDPTVTTTTVFNKAAGETNGSHWKYLDDGSNQLTAWRSPSFDDSSWASDPSRLGYGNDGEVTQIEYGSDAGDKHITTYFRKTFDVAQSFDTAMLELLYDDAAVVYLNGNLVKAINFGTFPVNLIDSETGAAQSVVDGETEFLDVSNLLVVGSNTLAIEIHQVHGGSSDLSFDAQLVLTQQANGGDGIVLNRSANVQARAFSDGEWSALRDATFVIPASQSELRVSEIHFNPAAPSAAEIAAGFDDSDDFEFIELHNPNHASSINLDGVQLADGVTFSFGDYDLLPGERVVVTEDVDAFMARYGDSVTVLGQWSGGLSNSGEEVVLLDSSMDEIMSVNYSDNAPWHSAADGAGFSLVLEDPANTPVNELGKYYSWRASTEFGGTPGDAAADRIGVVVNEVLANSDGNQTDTIELFNPTSTAIHVGGWYLSDESNDLLKFQIPAGTVISAGGYLVFDESDFNATATGFGLSASEGDQVYLSQAAAGIFQGLQDAVEFGATFSGESLGRLPNGSGRLTRMATTSLGSANGEAEVGPLVISEVNYHPESPSAEALAIDSTLTDNDLEYIEIANPTSAAIDLTNWRIRGEADYDFAPGTTLAAGEAILVITFDPADPANASKLAAFEAHYSIGAAVTIVGGLSESLSNSSGIISLQQPDGLASVGSLANVVVDEFIYDDLAPWPDADGSGQSLQRSDLDASAILPTHWVSATPTPGVFDSQFLLGDVNQDGTVDFLDISPFISLLQSSTFLAEADLNQDGVVNFLDISPFITILSSQ